MASGAGRPAFVKQSEFLGRAILLLLSGMVGGMCAVQATEPVEQLKDYNPAQKYTQAEREAMYVANWQRDISDADFFGVFANGAWEKKPMLDYASNPKLAAVEAAAKKGDYKAAATALLAHFRERWPAPPAHAAGGTPLRVELWKSLFFGFDQQIEAIAEFEVGMEPRICSIPVPVKSGVVVFQLMGRHKNGVVSQVSSRESDHPPILELRYKDGRTSRITASADTFIRAGEHATTNYGAAKTIEICNSGLKTGKPFDDDTRYGLIAFDVSKVDLTGLESAILQLHAWTNEPGQKIALFQPYETVVKESTLSWNTNIGYIYCWEGLPGGVDWNPPEGSHAQFMSWTGRIYWFNSLTDWALAANDPQAVRFVLDQARDFASDYPRLRKPQNELNSSMRLTYFSKCLPRLFASSVCTPEDCVELLKAVVRDGTELSLARSGDGGNVGPGIYKAMLVAGATWPELADSKRWIEGASRRLNENLANMVLGDGAYIEHTFGYPFVVLESMLELVKAYQDMALQPPAALTVKTWQLSRYLMLCSMPNGLPPAWGEGGPRNSQVSPVIRLAARQFEDPELRWWTGGGKTGHAPKATDISYPEAKIGVLRSGWDPNANVLFFSPRVGGGHYHVDANMVVLHAYGRRLLDDTGMSSYSQSHPHFDWQRHQTRSHNTVEVDEHGFPRFTPASNYLADLLQEGPCGLAVFRSDRAKLMEGWAEGYPKVRHERLVFALKDSGFYVILDRLLPKDKDPHTYDQCWHFHPDNSFESDPATGRVWTTNKDAANLEILSVYPPKPELLLRKGFNASGMRDTIYPSYRQKTAGNAAFLTVLNPSRPGTAFPALDPQLIDTKAGVRALRFQTDGGEGILTFKEIKGVVNAGTIQTDADCAYVQFDKDGKFAWAVRKGGSMMKVADKDVPCEVMQGLEPPALP